MERTSNKTVKVHDTITSAMTLEESGNSIDPDAIETLLRDRDGVLRFGELLEKANASELVVRREVDRLWLAGRVWVGPVGDHIMVRWDGNEGSER